LKVIQELSDQQTQVEESEVKDFKCIDLFGMRVLSLLVCRGHPREKAEFLAKLITKDAEDQDNIALDNERMLRAIKILLYCSSILPHKFLSQMRND
jgi:hypothetical protein